MLATTSLWEFPELVLLGLYGLTFIVPEMLNADPNLTLRAPDGKLPIETWVAVYLWLMMSGVAAAIANAKKREGVAYLALSLVISPVVGIVLAWALPPLGKSPTTSGWEETPGAHRVETLAPRYPDGEAPLECARSPNPCEIEIACVRDRDPRLRGQE